MKGKTVMSRDGHITPITKKLKAKRDRAWFERKVSEIGRALEQLPEDRRANFEAEVLDGKR